MLDHIYHHLPNERIRASFMDRQLRGAFQPWEQHRASEVQIKVVFKLLAKFYFGIGALGRFSLLSKMMNCLKIIDNGSSF